MNDATRSVLERATQRARRTLETEFRQQLEGTYNILPNGTILPEPGAHLDARGRLIREKLVAAISYRRAAGATPQDALDATVREAAFTTLNRFAALKMLEARGVVQECVSKGDQSAGFREFGGLADGLIALPDRGYRLYLESLFDEIGREVRVLFDRRDVAGMVWPRRQALTELLATLNDPQLAPVWNEDETVGWVYQYFNSRDERKKMRDESQAPRNSRELAVRNQFFTPRYVVEFLVDNTLGKLWYEMRQGTTRLGTHCQYFAPAPTHNGNGVADKHPTRNVVDPRTLRILDPACGSGHFLLRCFDLLLVIYEEAWDECPELLIEYRAAGDKAAFLRQVPSLVLRYNLHGVDIDARAAQIAELALWMRAQRAYAALGVRGADRPAIRKTNIVVAEPMPGDRALLEEFLREIDPRLQPLVTTIWEKMQLAGEAGTLLKIETEIDTALQDARRHSLVDAPARTVTTVTPDDASSQAAFEFSTTHERTFWDQAEMHLLGVLERYAQQATGASALQRRLFAENAAQGFAFIDVCRKHYDVVLMNPPFGAASKGSKSYIERSYPRTKNDVYAAFVERGLELLKRGGLVGAITSRTGFFLSSFQRWREEIVLGAAQPTVFADLGYGVLDDAMVETAAYCLQAK